MSKTKKSGASHYEILFILPNKFTDDEAKTVYEKVEKLIANNGGEITHREYWGKKRLAYEIKHNAFGYYGLFEFNLEKTELSKVESSLRLSTDVLRHQIVAKRQKTAMEIAQAEAIRAKIGSKKAIAEKKAEDKKAEDQKESAKTKAEPQETPKTMRSNFNDLDDKLEGIINAKDLI